MVCQKGSHYTYSLSFIYFPFPVGKKHNLLNNARAAISALDNLTTKSEVAKKRDVSLEHLV